MPYITDKKKIGNPALDRRVKLLPHQKKEIKRLHKRGMAIRAITRKYKVNRRLIQFILFPERHKKNLADRKTRGGTMKYYNKDYHREKMKDHRRYKYAVLTGKKDSTPFIKSFIKKINKWNESYGKHKNWDDANNQKARDELRNWYVIANFRAKTGLSAEDIKKYPALVEAMRQHMKFRRAVREKLKNKSTNKNQ